MLINKSNKSLPLLTARGINNNVSCGHNSIALDSDLFIEEIIGAIANNSSVLPINPGFELHPYKGVLQNIEAVKYIIGTFPPLSYLIDSIRERNLNITALKQPTHPNQKIDEPQIPFFHGNVSGLWSVLFTEAELSELKRIGRLNRYDAKEFLINWLNENGIYYDDIILYTQRKLGKLKPSNNLALLLRLFLNERCSAVMCVKGSGLFTAIAFSALKAPISEIFRACLTADSKALRCCGVKTAIINY